MFTAAGSLSSNFDQCGVVDVLKATLRKVQLLIGRLDAMESCLIQEGLLGHSQVMIERHRQTFKAACDASRWTADPCAELCAIFNVEDLSSGVVGFLDAFTSCHLQLPCGDALAAIHKRTSEFHLVGGVTSLGKLSETVRCFNGADGTWRELPHKMPIRGFGCGAAVLQGRIYLCGVGFDDYSGRVMTLDVHSDPKRAWKVHTSKQGPQTPRVFSATAVLAGKLYICGGETTLGNHTLSSVERFDPNGKAIWEVMPPMLEARTSCRGATLAGKLAVCGGTLGGPSWASTIKGTSETFDAESLSWQAAPSMTAPRCSHCIASLAGRIFVCGGFGEGYPYALQSAEAFDTAHGVWIALSSMCKPRTTHSVAVLGRKLYICGGESGDLNHHGFECLSTTECFDPERGVWELQGPMPGPKGEHSAAVVTILKDR